MKNNAHLTIVFIAFVLGQAIQLFVSAMAYNLYANRPVMWNIVAALISIFIVVVSFIIIKMESLQITDYKETYLDYAKPERPPLDTDPEPIEFDEA